MGRHVQSMEAQHTRSKKLAEKRTPRRRRRSLLLFLSLGDFCPRWGKKRVSFWFSVRYPALAGALIALRRRDVGSTSADSTRLCVVGEWAAGWVYSSHRLSHLKTITEIATAHWSPALISNVV